MDDNVWDELLASPYDEGRRQRRGDDNPPTDTGPMLLIVGVVAAIAAGVAVGWLLAPEAEPVAATSTTTTLAPTSTVPVVDTGFLIGYEPLDETAFAAIAQFQSAGSTYVAVAEIVPPGADRETVPPEPIATYQLAADGLLVDAATSFSSVLTPGIRIVEFPELVGGGSVSMARGTQPTPNESTRETSVPIAGGVIGPPFDGLPFSTEEPNIIGVSGDTFISIDSIQVAQDWGTVQWHIEGDDDVVAKAEFFIEYVGAESEDGALAILIPAHAIGPRFGQSQPPSPPGFSKGRTEQLTRTGPHTTDENPVTGLTMWWRIEWTQPTATTATLAPAPIYE